MKTNPIYQPHLFYLKCIFSSCVDANADERAKVDLLTNGVGFTSRWEANVFKFVNQPNVYLHCRVRICFQTENETCDVFNCETSRKRRAASETGEIEQVRSGLN